MQPTIPIGKMLVSDEDLRNSPSQRSVFFFFIDQAIDGGWEVVGPAFWLAEACPRLHREIDLGT